MTHIHETELRGFQISKPPFKNIDIVIHSRIYHIYLNHKDTMFACLLLLLYPD